MKPVSTPFILAVTFVILAGTAQSARSAEKGATLEPNPFTALPLGEGTPDGCTTLRIAEFPTVVPMESGKP